MTAINNCTPARIYGTFTQHLFLGLSVSSFSSNLGKNGAVTDVTIKLVQDTCTSTEGKTYYDNRLNQKTWNLADPGFTYPTIGSPAYFRVADFEYTGIIQSYERMKGENGDVFVVKLVDPTEILSGCQVILNDYAGGVNNLSNIFNAYGFAESFGMPCPGTEYKGANFGSDANAFGGSGSDHNGISWDVVKQSLSLLTSSIPATVNKWSPFGRILFRGSGSSPIYDDVLGVNVDQDGFGVIKSDVYNPLMFSSVVAANGYINEYFLDLSSVPSSFGYHRLAGETMSIADIISDVCTEAGYDWYIELVPVKYQGGIIKIIKVRTIYRYLQPILGQITTFLNDATGTSNTSVGYELRNEVCSALVVGAPVESIYQASGGLISEGGVIEPYWGVDINNNVIETVTVKITNNDPDDDLKIDDQPVVGFFVDISYLNNTLQIPFSTNTVFITVDEIRAAAKSEDSWRTWCLNINKYVYGTGTVVETGATLSSVKTFAKLLGDRLTGKVGFAKHIVGMLEWAITGAVGDISIDAFFESEQAAANDKLNGTKSDLQAVFNFVSAFTEFYGKRFMVRMPYNDSVTGSITAIKKDSSTDVITTSESPCDSGWTDPSLYPTVVDLPNPSVYLDYFSEESGKIKPFLKFFSADPPISLEGKHIPDKGLFLNGAIYIPAEVETDKFVYLDSSSFYSPRVLISIDQSVHVKKPITDVATSARLFAEIIDTMALLMDGGAGLGADPGKTFTTNVSLFINNQMFNLGMDTKAFMPVGAAIPIKSNTRVYGPWTISGPPGQTKMEVNAGLTPWNYGSLANMNLAGNYSAKAALTYMQVGEQGSVTVPGFPALSLGSELSHGAPSLIETRQAVTGNSTLSSGLTYVGVDEQEWTGLEGPNIDNISCEIGQNAITTTYTMRTYTPKFNRFGKYNLDRFQNLGKKQVKLNRTNRILAYNQYNALRNKVNQDIRGAIEKKKDEADGNTPVTILTGQSSEFGSKVNISKHGEVVNEFTSSFSEKSVMSLDGLIRPISKGTNSAGFSSIATPYPTGTTLPNISRQSKPPILNDVDHSGGYTSLDINSNYLHPYIDKGDPQYIGATGNPSYHDIAEIAFGSSPNPDGINLKVANEVAEEDGRDGPFEDSNNYRPLAFRGPLMMTGWTYDLDGKPVPNENPSNPTDRFAEDWLQNPDTWPTGPVDLRWDAERGVFTCPTGFRMVRAKLLENLDNTDESHAEAEILSDDGLPIYDQDGAEVEQDSLIISVWCPFVGPDEPSKVTSPYAKKDEILVCYYNSEKGKYFGLRSGESTKGIPFKNYSGETIKKYQTMEVSGVDNIGGIKYLKCIKPTANFDRRYLVNLDLEVSGSGIGLGTWLESAGTVEVSSSGGGNGIEEYGVTPGSFLLKAYNPGFQNFYDIVISGSYYINAIQREVRNVIGKCEYAASKNSTTQLKIHTGKATTGETDSGLTLTGSVRFGAVAAAKWCSADWLNGNWYITQVEC